MFAFYVIGFFDVSLKLKLKIFLLTTTASVYLLSFWRSLSHENVLLKHSLSKNSQVEIKDNIRANFFDRIFSIRSKKFASGNPPLDQCWKRFSNIATADFEQVFAAWVHIMMYTNRWPSLQNVRTTFSRVADFEHVFNIFIILKSSCSHSLCVY